MLVIQFYSLFLLSLVKTLGALTCTDYFVSKAFLFDFIIGNKCIKSNGIHPKLTLFRTGMVLSVDLSAQKREDIFPWQSNKTTMNAV